jgi:hypothetical protein
MFYCRHKGKPHRRRPPNKRRGRKATKVITQILNAEMAKHKAIIADMLAHVAVYGGYLHPVEYP